MLRFCQKHENIGIRKSTNKLFLYLGKALKRHQISTHNIGSKRKIARTVMETDSRQWREDRKNNYPTTQKEVGFSDGPNASVLLILQCLASANKGHRLRAVQSLERTTEFMLIMTCPKQLSV